MNVTIYYLSIQRNINLFMSLQFNIINNDNNVVVTKNMILDENYYYPIYQFNSPYADLEQIFELFNSDENPLSDNEYQNKIRETITYFDGCWRYN